MLIVIIAAVLCVLVGIAVGVYESDRTWGAAVGSVLIGFVLVIWGILVWGVQPYQESNCRKAAEGYDLPGYEWTFRLGCRMELPTGQLVPEGRIRITSDGRIVVSDES